MKNKAVIGILALAALCGFFVRSETNRLEAKIEQSFTDLNTRIDSSQLQLAKNQQDLLNRIEQVEKIVSVLRPAEPPPADPRTVVPEKNSSQKLIKPGLYIMDRKIKMQNAGRNGYYEGDFTIYHIKAALGSGDGSGKEQTEINIGLAIGDLITPPVFYLDYNRDNIVDAEMMRDFASFGPLGPLLRRGINERNSQAAYNEFLNHYSSAKYTSVDSIEQSSESIAGSLWKFVKDQSASMLDWINLNGTPGADAAASAGEEIKSAISTAIP